MNLKQIKKIHCLEGKNVSYGIIKQTIPGRVTPPPSLETKIIYPSLYERELRQSKKEQTTKLGLGLYIKNSHLYFDFQSFKFYTTVNLSEIRREIVPARKYRRNGEFLFRADDGTELVLPSHYFDDIYGRMIYTPEMSDMVFL